MSYLYIYIIYVPTLNYTVNICIDILYCHSWYIYIYTHAFDHRSCIHSMLECWGIWTDGVSKQIPGMSPCTLAVVLCSSFQQRLQWTWNVCQILAGLLVDETNRWIGRSSCISLLNMQWDEKPLDLRAQITLITKVYMADCWVLKTISFAILAWEMVSVSFFSNWELVHPFLVPLDAPPDVSSNLALMLVRFIKSKIRNL